MGWADDMQVAGATCMGYHVGIGTGMRSGCACLYTREGWGAEPDSADAIEHVPERCVFLLFLGSA